MLTPTELRAPYTVDTSCQLLSAVAVDRSECAHTALTPRWRGMACERVVCCRWAYEQIRSQLEQFDDEEKKLFFRKLLEVQAGAAHAARRETEKARAAAFTSGRRHCWCG